MTEEQKEPQERAEPDEESIRDLEVDEDADYVTGGRKAGGTQDEP